MDNTYRGLLEYMLETLSLTADVITDTEQSVPVSVLCKTLSALGKVIRYDSNAFFETTVGPHCSRSPKKM
jgi:hypothetical protein